MCTPQTNFVLCTMLWALIKCDNTVRDFCLAPLCQSGIAKLPRHSSYPLFFFFYHQIILIQYSSCVPLYSFSHCCEVMSPWHEGRNLLHSPCRSICGLTYGSREILNGDGLAAEHLPLSNYMTASREGELPLHDPFMVPDIPFLFILNLFVQSSPLMLATPSSPRHWESGKR